MSQKLPILSSFAVQLGLEDHVQLRKSVTVSAGDLAIEVEIRKEEPQGSITDYHFELDLNEAEALHEALARAIILHRDEVERMREK